MLPMPNSYQSQPVLTIKGSLFVVTKGIRFKGHKVPYALCHTEVILGMVKILFHSRMLFSDGATVDKPWDTVTNLDAIDINQVSEACAKCRISCASKIVGDAW